MEAVRQVEEGKVFASFEFQSNYSRCMLNRARRGYKASDYDIECSQIRVHTDHTYQFVIFHLALEGWEAFKRAIYKFFPKFGVNPETLNMPVQLEELVYGTDKFSYTEFMTPGMVCT